MIDNDANGDTPLTADEDEALFAELERRRVEHESGRDPGLQVDEFFRTLRGEASKPSEG